MYKHCSCWCDMTYDQVWWLILGICALHLTPPQCTHTQWTHTRSSEHTQWTHTHTHCEHTHTHTHGAVGSHICCGARGAVGGSVPCSRVEGGESAVHSLPPPTIPAGPRLEPTTFELRVLLSNIRPRLPPDLRRVPVSLSLSDGFTWFYLIVFFMSTLKLHLINLKLEFFFFIWQM